MKKMASFVALFLGLGLLASAQEHTPLSKKEMRHRGKAVHQRFENKSPEEIATAHTKRLDKVLKLTDKQRKEVYAFNLNQAKENRERGELEKQRKVARRKEIKSDRERFIKLLTPDQQKIMNDKLADRKGRRMEGRFRGKNDGERMKRKQIEEKPEMMEGSNS